MSNLSTNSYAFTAYSKANPLALSTEQLLAATNATNKYLHDLPGLFDSSIIHFYTTLNQRNLSGFIGEVYKHVIHALVPQLVPNPHPDGRPDILDLRSSAIKAYFDNFCFDQNSGAPLREHLAPFKHGGVEVKCSIGNTPNAGSLSIGDPRSNLITGINYWAHHAHPCTLLGLYYDYCNSADSSPQIKGLIYCNIQASDWNPVSVGRPDKKKTSNTSLNRSGVSKLKNSLVMHSTEAPYVQMFKRLGFL